MAISGREAEEVQRQWGRPNEVFTAQRDDHPRLAATVLTVLERERKIMADNLVAVRAKDYSEYLNRLGQIEGLDIAISHAKDVAKKLG